MATPSEESAPGAGADRLLAVGRRRGLLSAHVRFPGRDMRPRRSPGPHEVPEARTVKGRQILIAVAGAALLVREVARQDWGDQQEQAARKAWDLLGGILVQLETATPRMHEELAKRNAVLLQRLRDGIGVAEDPVADG